MQSNLSQSIDTDSMERSKISLVTFSFLEFLYIVPQSYSPVSSLLSLSKILYTPFESSKCNPCGFSTAAQLANAQYSSLRALFLIF